MRKVILDTDTISEAFKQRHHDVMLRVKTYLHHYPLLTYTSVSSVEILAGLYAKDAKNQLSKVEQFLARHEEVVPESEDYKLSGQIIGMLTRMGRPIGSEDPLIAACAINRHLPVATSNTRHYQFVIDAGFPVDIDSWREAIDN